MLANPEKPLTAIIGGAKVSSKLGIIEHLIGRVDRLIVGGGMAYTFVQAQGGSIGTSLAEPEMHAQAQAILEKAQIQRNGVALANRYVVRRCIRCRMPTPRSSPPTPFHGGLDGPRHRTLKPPRALSMRC